ncbi:MAG: heavy metal-binding domain-containing protein, partial [Nitrospirota bacterium]
MKVKDPVCGMSMEKQDAAAAYTFQGKTYHFCSTSCKDKFEKDSGSYMRGEKPGHGPAAKPDPSPEKNEQKSGSCPTCDRDVIPGESHEHAAKSEWTCPMHPEIRQAGPGSCPKWGMALEPVEPLPVSSKTEWTCPMHPEIVRDAPGSCPICGMALEPRTVSLEEEENPELIDMTRRFKVGTVLTIPLVYIAMGGYIPAISPAKFIPMEMLKWVELILATPVVLWAGWPFFVRGWKSIVTWNPNMFTLIGLDG